MSNALNFWIPADKLDFHRKIVDLYNWNREPQSAEGYRGETVQESERYVLACRDELHIADHIAFLAQSKEGAKTVSAVAVEEHREDHELRIRVAANKTPSPDVVGGLRNIMDTVQAYAVTAKMRDKHLEELFDKVIMFSNKRLHGRLRSKKSPRRWPSSPGLTSMSPLFLRIRKKLQALRSTSPIHSGAMKILYGELEDLARVYENVDHLDGQDAEQELLKAAVEKSFVVSTLSHSRSLEGQLKLLGYGTEICQSREVLQVDKIARYLVLCKDLLRYSRRYTLFTTIIIEFCTAPEPLRPPGSIQRCHVHGEIQLILHYEQHPHNPPPRAIGSSKSACFLCDMFIKEHGWYRISHSHKRLYPQWTIPDVDWMTVEQASRFQKVVRTMIRDLHSFRRQERRRQGEFNGAESRAHLLLLEDQTSLASTPSVLSQHMELDNGTLSAPHTPAMEPETLGGIAFDASCRLPSISETRSLSRTSTRHSSSSVSLSSADIPYSQPISIDSPTLGVQIEEFRLVFEFLNVGAGTLLIQWVPGSNVRDCPYRVVDVLDIPCETEMRVGGESSSGLTFVLKLYGQRFIRIVFTWGDSNSLDKGKGSVMGEKVNGQLGG